MLHWRPIWVEKEERSTYLAKNWKLLYMADGSSFQIVSKRISNYSTSTNVGVSKPIRDFFPIYKILRTGDRN